MIKVTRIASARGEESETISNYEILERDKYDNWTKRKVKQTIKLYSSYDDGPLDKPKIDTKEKIEERSIDYYTD